MYVRIEVFQSQWTSWKSLLQKAADFATTVGPDRLIGVTHSIGTVTVWYWSDEPSPRS